MSALKHFFFTVLFAIGMAITTLAPTPLTGQSPKAPLAPLPSQITNAKNVFVANGGDDPHFKSLGPQRAYNQFYSALKDWGHYELVGSPADADVVLEISLTTQLSQFGSDLRNMPLLKLVIADPKTHTLLWVSQEELETGGIVGAHQDSKFDKAMERIVGDLKNLASQGASSLGSPKP